MKKYYFIGIKGAGMSALACILKDLGNEVSGSDIENYFFTEDKLTKAKINFYKFSEKNIENLSMDHIIIKGNAFDEKNVEVSAVISKGMEMMTYNELLSSLEEEFEISVAVSGAHGKTTTTGLMAANVKDYNPTVLIGDGTGYSKKDSKIFVYEACEYREHFLLYKPKVGIILNIEFDHPDYFENEDHTVEVFLKFAKNCNKVVINGDDELCQKIEHNNKITFGQNENNDWIIKNIVKSTTETEYDLVSNDETIHVKIPFFGIHMVYNTAASILAKKAIKPDDAYTDEIWDNLKNAKRRFNIYELKNNNILIDDYAHHPTEIKVTIDAVRQKYPEHKIVIFFQPHTFSRTESLLKEFSEALKLGDEINILEIFASAREKTGKVTSEDLANLIDNANVIKDIDRLTFEKYNDSVICILGAGDIDTMLVNKAIKEVG